jgi:hypothetical protein
MRKTHILSPSVRTAVGMKCKCNSLVPCYIYADEKTYPNRLLTIDKTFCAGTEKFLVE